MARQLELTQYYSWVRDFKAEHDRKLLAPLLCHRNTLRTCLDERLGFSTKSSYI